MFATATCSPLVVKWRMLFVNAVMYLTLFHIFTLFFFLLTPWRCFFREKDVNNRYIDDGWQQAIDSLMQLYQIKRDSIKPYSQTAHYGLVTLNEMGRSISPLCTVLNECHADLGTLLSLFWGMRVDIQVLEQDT